MKTSLESSARIAFTQRLRTALLRAKIRPSATVLAREFNLRAHESPVSVHAARKWLIDGAMPVDARLQVLSEILGVTPQWLRFGDGASRESQERAIPRIPHEIVMMLSDVQRLDPPSRQLVDALVGTMLKLQNAE